MALSFYVCNFLSLIKFFSLLSASDVVWKASSFLFYFFRHWYSVTKWKHSFKLWNSSLLADNTEQKGTTLFFQSLQSFHQSRSRSEYFRRNCAVVYKVMLKEFRILVIQKVKILGTHVEIRNQKHSFNIYILNEMLFFCMCIY